MAQKIIIIKRATELINVVNEAHLELNVVNLRFDFDILCWSRCRLRSSCQFYRSFLHGSLSVTDGEEGVN